MKILRWTFCAALLLSAALFASERFILLADLHVSPGNANEAQLRKVVEEINAGDYNFALIAGDITNTGSLPELESVAKIVSGLKLPWYMVPGNHETNWSPSAGRDYARIFGTTTPVFRNKNMVFFGFDCGPFMRMGDGVVPPDNLVDIDQKLKKIDQKGSYCLAFGHYPLNAKELSNSAEVIDFLRAHNVRAYFCGHLHILGQKTYGGVPNLIARALWNWKNFGYNIIEIDENTVRVYDKVLGEKLGKPVITFQLADDYSNEKPELPQPQIPANSRLEKIIELPEMIYTAATEKDGVVYFGTSRGTLFAWDLAQKKPIWQRTFSGPLYSRPCVTEDLVLFGTTDCRIMALNRKDGSTRWESKAVSPVVADGTIAGNAYYIGLGTKAFAKFDVATGKRLWTFEGVNHYMQGAPDIKDGRVIFGAWDLALRCLDDATGKLLWQWNINHGSRLVSPGNTTPKIVGNQVMLVSPDRKLTALDVKTGKEIYRLPYKKVRESFTASQDRKFVYAKTMDSVLLKLAADQPAVTEVWTTELGWGYELNPCPPLELNGIVYVAGHKGQMAAVDAATGKIIWNAKIGTSAINRISAGSQGIYAPLLEGRIWRIKK